MAKAKKQLKKRLRIAVVFNQQKEAEDGLPEDMYAEFDEIGVPLAIKKALEKNTDSVDSVDILEADETLFSKLVKGRYNFVFNMAEGLKGESRESHVPAILEMLGIPYSGSGVLAHAITLDKAKTKDLLLYYGIPTPAYQLFGSPDEKLSPGLRFPFVVKPNAEGSSKGIRDSSFVNNEAELRKMVELVIKTYKQKALVEEYLQGREFTVSLLGNSGGAEVAGTQEAAGLFEMAGSRGRIYRLPILEIFVHKYHGSSGLCTYKHKFVVEDDSFSSIADIPSFLKQTMYEMALKTFKVLGCRDMSRIDMRCDENDRPFVIEVNSLPGMHPKVEHVSYLTKAARLVGISYDDMINAIAYFALERNSMPVHIDETSAKQLMALLDKADKGCG